ncbi:MAG: cytochrome C assembly protein [Sulfobacillus benefaciens]|uniref:Cytochrome C assembly protein n=1 Tax=Sulfobacillus benefaciens TaxID=453960 RepID=A0A2T2XJZ7_9FIRM|nr:MAG: cytochrome C assembly protein [Sulfobacillus benefaciens]
MTFVGYLMASVLYVGALYEGRRERWGRYGVLAGWAAQTIFLITDAITTHGLPVATLYDWMSFFVWLMISLFLVIQLRRNYTHIGSFLVPIVFLLWLVSQFLAHHNKGTALSATGAWLGLHIVLATASYAAFLFAAVFGIMYTEKERELKNKRVRLFYYQLPPLDEMDEVGSHLVMLGVPLLAVALVLGAYVAKSVSGYYWTWTAKEIWSLVIWLVYAGYLTLRWVAGWRGHRAAVYVMLAFLLVIINFWGINTLFPGAGYF